MSIPSRMTAIAIRAPGAPDVLVPEERAVPSPGAGEVLVKIAAAGINRPDVMQREGKYPPPPGAPDIPGLELAGEVVALGEGVKRWKVGDKVCALVPGGGYAEYWVTHETHRASRDPAAHDGRGGGDPGDVLHGVAQCVRARRAESRRDDALPWRLVRHRHHGDHAGEGVRRARHRHGRLDGEVRRLPQARRRCRDRLQHAGLRRRNQEGDRRQGRRS